MSSKHKIKKGRQEWKTKAIKRGDDNRYFKKESFRYKRERNEQRARAERAEERIIILEQQVQQLAVRSKVDLVLIALQLFLVARIGYRAVSRVLTILAKHLGCPNPPCPQTVINWVIRLSIAHMQHAAQLIAPQLAGDVFSNGFIWMIDTSIGLNNEKILAVLALDAHHYGGQTGAPTLQNVHCIAVSVSISWTGDAIAEFLKKLIGVMGRPAAILKDGGTDLAKAVRLLNEQGMPCLSVDDISHFVANLFKHEYKDHPLFNIFITECGKISKQLKQSVLACFVPPKTSIKARFMNVHRLFNWANQLLQHSPPGRAAKGSMLEKLRTSFGDLPECKALIMRFINDANPLLECQKILKTYGLSNDTKMACIPLIEKIPTASIRLDFMSWLDKQFEITQTLKLATVGMPITSDPIESLFGVGKHHGVGELKDANRIALRLPALCGTLTREDAQRVIKITVAQQEEVTNSLISITKQRRNVFATPGTLETIAPHDTKKKLVLIPKSKSWSKNENYQEISNGCEKILGPNFEAKNETIFPKKTEFIRHSRHR